MVQPIISNNLEDFYAAIQSNLSAYFLYKNSKNEVHKLIYTFEKEKIQLAEYKFYPELNNTFRLIKNMPIGDKKAAIELVRHWYNLNKNNVTILNKSETKLFTINAIKESSSCWKNLHQLKKMIDNGLEVPCTSDSLYTLDEAQIFLTKKNRELIGKYKKAIEWLDDVIANGDKDYAEKALQVIEKWKRFYEDKIKLAKSYLKENEDVITADEMLDGEQRKIKFYLNKTEKTYQFYQNLINTSFEEKFKKIYLDKLKDWHDRTIANLKSYEKEIDSGSTEAVLQPIPYTGFGLLDLTENFEILNIETYLRENAKDQIAAFVKKSNSIKSDLAKFKEDSGFDNLSFKEKDKLLRRFFQKHKQNPKLISQKTI